ncbi:MAG: hypothetical protein ACREJ3_06265 [Polyangiaceae bacterium]
MSFRRATARARAPRAGEFEERLVQEINAPSQDPNAQPVIIAEPPGPGAITRLFVIWDDWAALPQQDRSEIIMDAYLRAQGQAESVQIAVAMGLTAVEASRIGIVP